MTGDVTKSPFWGFFMWFFYWFFVRFLYCVLRSRLSDSGGIAAPAPALSTGDVSARENKLQALLAPTVEALGFELWGVEHLSQGAQPAAPVHRVRKPAYRSMTARGSANRSVRSSMSRSRSAGSTCWRCLRRVWIGACSGWSSVRLRGRERGGAPAQALRRATKIQGHPARRGGETWYVLVDDHEYLLPFGDGNVDRAQLSSGLRI
jgi:ribosome maturation factor RimP